MFDDLQKRLANAIGKFRGRGVLTEDNIRDGLREVRTALLEADVNLQVVQAFMAKVQEQAVGEKLVRSVRPEQQIVKIVHDELVALMGPVDPSIRFEKTGPTILMLCGLQGSGKTTTCGKLAKMLELQGRKPLMVAADLQRPAAVDQLKTLGQQLGVPVHSETGATPVQVCQNAIVAANRTGRDTIILDTAGRLHIDNELMAELRMIEKKAQPHHILFVCDALTGQDAVNSAKAFDEALTLNGIIMTKLDGDARGGAALSVKHITGVPIKFMGVGEKLDRLEPFDAERIAGQILGMGDIVGLVSAAQQAMDHDEALRQQQKLSQGKFDLNDFRKQIAMMKKMGSVKDMLKKIPGFSGGLAGLNLEEMDADSDITKLQGIIDSMTPDERRDPDLIDTSRRRRIAKGAGVDPADVSAIVKNFDTMAGMMRNMASLNFVDRIRQISTIGSSGMLVPGAKLPSAKQSTGKRLSPKEREKLRKQREKDERKARKDQKNQGKG